MALFTRCFSQDNSTVHMFSVCSPRAHFIHKCLVLCDDLARLALNVSVHNGRLLPRDLCVFYLVCSLEDWAGLVQHGHPFSAGLQGVGVGLSRVYELQSAVQVHELFFNALLLFVVRRQLFLASNDSNDIHVYIEVTVYLCATLISKLKGVASLMIEQLCGVSTAYFTRLLSFQSLDVCAGLNDPVFHTQGQVFLPWRSGTVVYYHRPEKLLQGL